MYVRIDYANDEHRIMSDVSTISKNSIYLDREWKTMVIVTTDDGTIEMFDITECANIHVDVWG